MAIQHVKDTLGLIQTAGSTYIGNDADQTYIINPNVVGAGDTITIVDKGGANKIQLTQGVEIVKSVVVADETQLTLSNGAVINVRGADTFTFNIGGDAINGVEGVDVDFQSFAEEVLGVSLPAEGEPPVVVEPEVVINDDGTVTKISDIKFTEVIPEPENMEVPAGTVITTITLEDGVTYTLEGDDADMYELNSETGEITVKEAYTPDFETQDAYNFTIKAVDADGNEVTQEISIPVEDIEPEFTIEMTEIVPTPENTEIPAGTVITSIVNFDPNITYTLEGDDASLYEIDSETGEIKVKEAYTPDYETKDAYNIVVKAVDTDGNEITQDVTIPVEDIDPEPIELTKDDDTLDGSKLTDGDDIITAEAGTLSSDDLILDPSSDDNDILNATVSSDSLAPRVMNVETINLSGEYAKVGLNLANVVGAKTISASASITGSTAKFTDVTSVAVEKVVAGENIDTLSLSAAAGGTTDSVLIELGDAKKVELTGGAKDDLFTLDLNGGSKDLEIASGSSIESVTINSNGSANELSLTEAAAGLLEKLVVEGDQDLTLNGDITQITGATAGLLVESNGSGDFTFVASGATASGASLNRAAFDEIDLKQKIKTSLTINEASKLIIETAPTGTATIKVDNVDGDMGAGEGTLKLEVATDVAKLVIDKNAGTLVMTQDTADTTLTELDTSSTSAEDTTVVLTGSKDLEITTWTNDSDEVFSAGDLEGNLVLGFASASAKGATVISGKGDDEITLGTLASGEEYTIVTNDGNDSVIASIGSAGEATVITGAGDDSIDVGSATAVSKITIDGGDGTDEFKFAADLTIGEDDSIDNIENFVDGASAAGQTLTIENMDVLSNMKEFIGVDPGSGSAIDTLKLIGSNGDDTIDLGSIKLTDATDVVQGGGGNDTVTFVKDDIAGETFIFETSASNNGVDTINNFVIGNVNGDILDFSDLLAGSASSAGSAAATADIIKDGDNAYTSNASALASASGKIALLVDIDGGQDITTADGLKEAIASGGEYSNLEIAASGSAGSLIIITSKSNQTDDSHIFYAEQTTAGDVTITEIGVVTDVDIDNFTGGSAGNFFV